MANPVLSIPVQPSDVNDVNYSSKWNNWIVNYARPAMVEYFDRFQAALEALGFRVVVTYTTAGDEVRLLVVPVWQGTMEKNGITSGWTMTLGQAQSRDPEEFAQHYAMWVWGSENGGQATIPPPAPTPGPASTVPTGGNTSQPTQSPSNTDSGTVVGSNPTGGTGTPSGSSTPVVEKHNFWEWNWYWEQSSGRAGPPPEDVGVSTPTAQITLAQWHTLVDAWYANGGVTPTGGGSTPSGGGGAPSGGGTPSGGTTTPAKDNTGLYIGGGIALLLAFLATRKG